MSLGVPLVHGAPRVRGRTVATGADELGAGPADAQPDSAGGALTVWPHRVPSAWRVAAWAGVVCSVGLAACSTGLLWVTSWATLAVQLDTRGLAAAVAWLCVQSVATCWFAVGLEVQASCPAAVLSEQALYLPGRRRWAGIPWASVRLTRVRRGALLVEYPGGRSWMGPFLDGPDALRDEIVARSGSRG